MSIDDVDRLKPFSEVLKPDERWQFLSNRSLEQHYRLIDQYTLHGGVPDVVIQHYENARNAWLYSFFSYRLLQVAIWQVHLAGEAALKERARQEGVSPKRKKLRELLDLAVRKRWLLDAHFAVIAEKQKNEAEHLAMLHSPSTLREPLAGPLHEQDYVKVWSVAFQKIRNALAHGDIILKPNLSWEFLTVRDLVNQLFPAADGSK